VMLNQLKSVIYEFFFVPLADWFCICRQAGFSGCCFPDTHSLAQEIRRIASIHFRVSTRLGRLAQLAI
ncbi:hypothetical protein M2G92_22535, partial [Vibrio vulnificus]|nr:hypothetical protein [Vibrio vulnificus]